MNATADAPIGTTIDEDEHKLETRLAAYARTRDPELRAELIVAYLPLVDRLARHFAHRGEPHEDLFQVGTVGLIKALDRFDPDRGASFPTYATRTVLGELKRHFRDLGWSVRPPRRVQELHLHIGAVTNDLTQHLGRSPTVRELARETGANDDQVLDALEAGRYYRLLSIDVPDEHGESLEERLDAGDTAMDRAELRALLAGPVESLSAVERLVVRLRFEDSLTQAEIAREIGASQMGISRVLSRCLRKLSRQLGPEA